jgi:hypothetical protein
MNPVAEAEKKLRAQFHYRPMGDDESHDSVICKLLIPALTQPPLNSHGNSIACYSYCANLGEVGAEIKKQSCLTATLSNSQNLSRRWQGSHPQVRRESYEMGTTLAACKPLGPSSTENSTFCSASNLR